MDVLKKISSATLLETMVASTIILVVFVVGSISLNNIFLGNLKGDTYQFDHRITELEYLSIHGKLSVPHYEDTDAWDISIEQKGEQLTVVGLNKMNDKEIIRKLRCE